MWKWILKRLDEQFPDFTVDRWWGITNRYERMIGSVLVQNTTWTNAAKALASLREQGLLDPDVLGKLTFDQVVPVIHSAGFQQAKSRTILSLTHWLQRHDGFEGNLRQTATEQLRNQLLSIKGVGEETADTILAYCFERPTISGDAYTRRLYERISGQSLRYGDIRRLIMDQLTERDQLARLHGLIVEHGKTICRKREPMCSQCPLKQRCLYASTKEP
ncbi:endonuclease [Brevibacillus humidisoli]|uniref:endonuclease III domain-containing protein n=1 Tax=Brevibacillus humidisoli TaxID=2895522 RepID=UPI001E648589|nr:endonuclease [Brevibacillus humidisoli]UFJ41871.1 endonuclease [Brevibacillus humidisoli]